MLTLNHYHSQWIDLRSDTVTHPTEEMLDAMVKADVGDDVYQDDPATLQLEELASKMVGKDCCIVCSFRDLWKSISSDFPHR